MIDDSLTRPVPPNQPDDVDVAPGLTQILNRVPEGWGKSIDCGPGWYRLLVELHTELDAVAPRYEVRQVKEKFGTLRFYWGHSAPLSAELCDQVDDIVKRAERLSAQTCEKCGAEGSLRSSRGRLKTLCEQCTITSGYIEVPTV